MSISTKQLIEDANKYLKSLAPDQQPYCFSNLYQRPGQAIVFTGFIELSGNYVIEREELTSRVLIKERVLESLEVMKKSIDDLIITVKKGE